MAKTLVIAEKPSVARDLAGALPGSFSQSKDKTHLVGDDFVITWAVGHLVGLAEPDAYDPKLQEVALRRPADRAREVQARAQRQPGGEAAEGDPQADGGRPRSSAIVNACDAGREGELIFAYVFETAEVEKPVRAAVAVLDDQEGDRGGVRAAAAGRGDEAAGGRGALALRGRLGGGHERHPRRVDPAAGGVRRRGVARPGADARRWRSSPAARRRSAPSSPSRTGWSRPSSRPPASAATRAATWAEAPAERRTRPPPSSRRSRASPGEITKLEKKEERERPQLLYDLTSLQRHANTLYGFSARRTLSAAQRLYEEHKALTYPRTNSRFLTGDMVAEIRPTAELVGHNPQYRRAAST